MKRDEEVYDHRIIKELNERRYWNILYKDYNGVHSPSRSSAMFYGDGRAAERIVRALAHYSFC